MPAQAHQSDIILVRLSELFLSLLNVRKDKGDEGIAELAQSILKDGVLQNLVGYEEPVKKGRKAPTRKEVIAGGRRWRALQLLLKQKKIDGNYLVPFKCVSKGEAIVLSLAENEYRKALHPADEFEAAKALQEEGKSIEDIAARLHLEPIVVQRRLKLAKVAPEFIDAYRKGELTMEHLIAFAVTDDHKKQREVWKGLGAHQRWPHAIRNLLEESEVPGSDPLARFVTLKVYEAAGGKTRRDLFDENHQVSFCDRALLTDLARKKLEKKANQLSRKESLTFVDVSPTVADRAVIASYSRVQTTRRAMTEEEQTRLDEIDAQIQALDPDEDASDEEVQSATSAEDPEDQDDGEDGELGEAYDPRYAELEEARDAILKALQVPNPEQLAKSGALLCISYRGEIQVEHRLLRAEDAKLFAQQANSEATDGTRSRKSQHSAALTVRLTQQRTLALRAEYVQHPEVALAAVIDRFVRNTLHLFPQGSGNALQICSPERHLGSGPTEAQGPAADFLRERRNAWSDRIRQSADVFQFILSLPLTEKLDLLAVCTSATLDAVQQKEGPSDADALAGALQLDLTRWWTPRADNYFNSVSMDVTLNAVGEHVPGEKLARLKSLKKKALAQEAEKLLEGKGWLPAFLRKGRPSETTDAEQRCAS